MRRLRKGIYIVPNSITLAALFCGFYAIVMAINGRFDYATTSIFAAMILDGMDGRAARMMHAQSAFGEQMDSLCDMVSFGVAPALVAYEWALRPLGRWGWIAAFVYCACAALRLARFNVNTAVVDKRYFQGLPSPAAAALVGGFIWLTSAMLLAHKDVPLFRSLLALAGGAPLLAARLESREERVLLDALLAEITHASAFDPLAAAATLDKVVKADKRPLPLKRLIDWMQKWLLDLALTPRYFVAQAATLERLARTTDVFRLLAFQRKALQYRMQCEQPVNSRLFLEAFFLNYAATFTPS